MSVYDKLMNIIRGQDGKVKAKKMRLTRADIQRNLVEIDKQIKNVQSDICSIMERMAKLDVSTEKGREDYEKLRAQLNDKNEIYSVFQGQQAKNLQHLETLNKSGRGDMVLKSVMVVGGIFLSVIGLGLNRESPSILKTIDFIMKPFRAPLKF